MEYTVGQKIREAVEYLDRIMTAKEIKDYVLNKWPATNEKTIDAQIQIHTVNHDSRINYEMNKKPRDTNSNSPYDILYKISRGSFEKYSPEKHGIWEIYESDQLKFKVRQLTDSENISYSPENIIWFKNVTNSELGQAYLDITKKTFVLNFPIKHRGNILKPKKGDIIVLYQKVKGIKLLTHLVTPINDLEYDENIRANYRYGREVKVIAKTDISNAIPVSSTNWKNINLSGVTQGNACRIENISGIDDLDLLKLDTWHHFKNFFIENKIPENITSILNELELENLYNNVSRTEGKLKLVSHLVRERNREIVNLKKAEALSNGTLFCEVCKFSFIDEFDAEFIECHHIVPISQSGERKTELKHHACVCSNCHRMLHRKFEGEYLSISQLREKLKKNHDIRRTTTNYK